MIKVSGGARTLQGVGAHFDYIGRKGLNEIETDMGEKLMERGFEKDLMLGLGSRPGCPATPYRSSDRPRPQAP